MPFQNMKYTRCKKNIHWLILQVLCAEARERGRWESSQNATRRDADAFILTADAYCHGHIGSAIT